YASKLANMTSIQSTLHQHNVTGGTYTIATPSYFYTNTVMIGMHDVSSGDTKQAQIEWKLDFIKPLISMQDANNYAFNSMMQQLASGVQTAGSGFGLPPTIGIPPSLATMNIAQTALASASAGVAGSQ